MYYNTLTQYALYIISNELSLQRKEKKLKNWINNNVMLKQSSFNFWNLITA